MSRPVAPQKVLRKKWKNKKTFLSYHAPVPGTPDRQDDLRRVAPRNSPAEPEPAEMQPSQTAAAGAGPGRDVTNPINVDALADTDVPRRTDDLLSVGNVA